MLMIEMNVSQSEAEYAVRLDAEEHQTKLKMMQETSMQI